MLKSLSIRNYALIETIEAEFDSGLNIITGETGAGKSIIVDAFGLILGERSSVDDIRKGAEKTVVEGIFGVSQNRALRALCGRFEIDIQDDLILRREISSKGQSRCFINDSPVPLNVLKSVGDALVDLHGQHDHQSLLRPETHIGLLDDFGRLEGLVKEYRQSFDTLATLTREHEALRREERTLKEKKELYAFQMKEIDAVDPQPDEEARLEAELRVLENAEQLHSSTAHLYELLYQGEQSVYDALVKARNQLEDLIRIDERFVEARKECESAVAIVDELTNFIQSYNSRVEFNPERLEEIRDRLGALSLLRKKYGGSLQAVIDHRQKIGRDHTTAENFDRELRTLEEKVEAVRAGCSEAAQRLSAKRRDLVETIRRNVVAELGKLGIANPQFDIEIRRHPWEEPPGSAEKLFVRIGKEDLRANERGIDDVEFQISTNAGEELKPLARVASGGEVSRVMLALKSILAKSDRLPLLIFDEIDSGVSGRIAQAVGRSLKSLSQFHQIITITHLPQIAGLADSHFVVEKVEKRNRTVTGIRKLDLEERVSEVAKLMSGAEVTEAGLEGARELMGLR
ncbi:MAG TPA: DNA repair protein RecN [Bacteroidota bacterium]|nr:DNA repair protein RecN [Bacteroidota bacterium]